MWGHDAAPHVTPLASLVELRASNGMRVVFRRPFVLGDGWAEGIVMADDFGQPAILNAATIERALPLTVTTDGTSKAPDHSGVAAFGIWLPRPDNRGWGLRAMRVTGVQIISMLPMTVMVWDAAGERRF